MTARSTLSAALLCGIATCTVSFSARAQFWDQGFLTPRFMTDYASATEGTQANPLTLMPCLYPRSPLDVPPGPDPIAIAGTCNTDKKVFPQGNAFSMNFGVVSKPRWTLVMNNEPWSMSLSGPPDRSLPRAMPGYGVMGFDAIVGSVSGEKFPRAHLVLNNTFASTSTHMAGADNLPFLGIAADARAGNFSNPGMLNTAGAARTVTFTSALWDVYPPTQHGAMMHQMWAFSHWDGKPRGLFLNLYSYGVSFSPSLAVPYTHSHWSWPIQESFFYPGGDLVFADVNMIDDACGGIAGDAQRLSYPGQQITYTVDLQTLFRCLSDRGAFDTPMPNTSLPILGVGWANEVTGAGTALWTSVHGMKMLTTSVPATDKRGSGGAKRASVPGVADASGPIGAPSAAVRDIYARLEEGCALDAACRAANKQRLATGQRAVVDPEQQFEARSVREVRNRAGKH